MYPTSVSRKSKNRRSTAKSENILVEKARETLHDLLQNLTPEEAERISEKSWRWSYIKSQFETRRLEDLFVTYTQKINHGYLSLFLILQFFISFSHFVLVLGISMTMNSIETVIPDLILYSIVAILPIIGLFISECYIKKHPHILRVMSLVAFIILFILDITVPILQSKLDYFRPAYTAHLIIACYIFFNVYKTYINCIMGITVTIAHIMILFFVTYKDSNVLYERVFADVTYMCCINGLGIYFRIMNEIVMRKSFLDRRACVESTLRLNFEKDQEEQLLQSIIPVHIFKELRNSVHQYIKDILHSDEIPKEHTHWQPYSNVTILYADIVNFTQLTVKLKTKQLVETLNDLFERFDDASEELGVLRIKFLGDCYYCVAGLPPKNIPKHAEACVDLGLRMIRIIRKVRDQRNIDVDMRIGVHTGSIVGGLIGIKKWQFDIWSNDVYIANKMESTGEAGKVHITQQTRDQLTKQYIIEPSNKGAIDEMLKKNNIQAYIISAPDDYMSEKKGPLKPPDMLEEIFEEPLENVDSTNHELNKTEHLICEKNYTPNLSSMSSKEKNQVKNTYAHFQRRDSKPVVISSNLGRRLSANPKKFTTFTLSERRFTPDNQIRRTAFMDNNIQYYQQRLEETDKSIREAIEAMPLAKYDQWFKVKEIHPLLLLFRNWKMEIDYIKQPDPLFKYYIVSEIAVIGCIIVIQRLTFPRWAWTSSIVYSILALVVLILMPLSWMQYAWRSCHKIQNTNMENHIPPRNIFFVLYKISQIITRSVLLRTLIYFLLCGLGFIYIALEMVKCQDSHGKIVNVVRSVFLYSKSNNSEAECIIPWHMTEICSLTIIMSFVFMRIHLWIKLLFTTAITVFYSYYVVNLMDDFYEHSETFNNMMQPSIAHIVSVIYLSLALHFIDRQTDYMNRLDFQWNKKLTSEQEEANEMHAVNSTLLLNILPKHVANYYLSKERKGLYYQEYKNVAVVFASIVNYTVQDDKQVLKLMSDIVRDFDTLLYEHKYIEKIKIINWTYMAACGLDTGENDKMDNYNNVVVTLLNFVIAMMNVLVKINRETGQDLKLRVGMAHGDVSAGVVGAKKPLYDIWGDPVNMASRMDSTGIPGKIQVTKSTATDLKAQNYRCDFRGNIYVKGKSKSFNVPDIPTYFVQLKTDYNQPVQLVRQKSINDEIKTYF